MPQIEITNCNSILQGSFSIQSNRLNIKYACNGVGKTTCAKALKYSINNDSEGLRLLTPFIYLDNEEHIPAVTGADSFSTVAIFNEDYIEQCVFRKEDEGELLKNSFEVFIKDSEYQRNEQEIQTILSVLQTEFFGNEPLKKLLEDIQLFIVSYGKQTKNGGISGASSIGKCAKSGNIIENIPESLQDFRPFIQGKNKLIWLQWQNTAATFLDNLSICPFCTHPLNDETKQKIRELSNSYDKKIVQHVSQVFDLFTDLKQYLNNDAQAKIEELKNSPNGFNSEQTQFVQQLQSQACILQAKLVSLQNIGFDLMNNEFPELAPLLTARKINLDSFPYFNTDYTQAQITPLNNRLDELIQQVGLLTGKIRRHQQKIIQTIQHYCSEINEFLDSAGYSYHVEIKQDKNAHVYKMFLQYKSVNHPVLHPNEHLSYGEKNAFALLLFLYQTLKENPDLIIFDDPISSFDGNKKFALINLLFMGTGKLSNKTVLLFTHDFNTIIDTLQVLKYAISPSPVGYFLTNNNGILRETLIQHNDIMSCIDIFEHRMECCPHTLNKLIYLRKLCELHRERKLEWHLLSSLFHKREFPTIYENRQYTPMTKLEIEEAQMKLARYLKSPFVYTDELKIVNDNSKMIELYRAATNNYEKLHIYRIIRSETVQDKIIKKFVDETFHVQNDSLFRLDPQKFEIVPEYIVKICDQDIQDLETELSLSNE